MIELIESVPSHHFHVNPNFFTQNTEEKHLKPFLIRGDDDTQSLTRTPLSSDIEDNSDALERHEGDMGQKVDSIYDFGMLLD